MVETSELSLESQARLAELSVASDEFFESFLRLQSDVTRLEQQVASPDSRSRPIEAEHASN